MQILVDNQADIKLACITENPASNWNSVNCHDLVLSDYNKNM